MVVEIVLVGIDIFEEDQVMTLWYNFQDSYENLVIPLSNIRRLRSNSMFSVLEIRKNLSAKRMIINSMLYGEWQFWTFVV